MPKHEDLKSIHKIGTDTGIYGISINIIPRLLYNRTGLFRTKIRYQRKSRRKASEDIGGWEAFGYSKRLEHLMIDQWNENEVDVYHNEDIKNNMRGE